MVAFPAAVYRIARVRRCSPYCFWCIEFNSARWFDWAGSVFGPLVGDDRWSSPTACRSRLDGWFTLCRLPRRTPFFAPLRSTSTSPRRPTGLGSGYDSKAELADPPASQAEKPAARPLGSFLLSHSLGVL